jgi:hypothetical protein
MDEEREQSWFIAGYRTRAELPITHSLWALPFGQQRRTYHRHLYSRRASCRSPSSHDLIAVAFVMAAATLSPTARSRPATPIITKEAAARPPAEA